MSHFISMLVVAGNERTIPMKQLITLPMIAFITLGLLSACEREGGSGNNANEQQKPVTPAKPAKPSE